LETNLVAPKANAVKKVEFPTESEVLYAAQRNGLPGFDNMAGED